MVQGFSINSVYLALTYQILLIPNHTMGSQWSIFRLEYVFIAWKIICSPIKISLDSPLCLQSDFQQMVYEKKMLGVDYTALQNVKLSGAPAQLCKSLRFCKHNPLFNWSQLAANIRRNPRPEIRAGLTLHHGTGTAIIKQVMAGGAEEFQPSLKGKGASL